MDSRTHPERDEPPGTIFDAIAWPAVSDAMSAQLARNWWAIALRGVFALLFGIAALLLPAVTLAALVLLYAAYMLADGILAIIAAVGAGRRHERWAWLAFEGIVDLIAGAIAFLAADHSPRLCLSDGRLGDRDRRVADRRGVSAARGPWPMGDGVWRRGLDHLGVLLIFWPLAGALVLIWWMAAYALFFGVALLVLAFRLRKRRHDVAAPQAG